MAVIDLGTAYKPQATAAKRGPPGEGAPAMPEECESMLDEEGSPKTKAR